MTRLLLLALCLACAAPAVAQVRIDAGPAAIDAALAHVRTAARGAGGSAEFVATGGHDDARSGASYVYVQQQVGGLDVAEAIVSVAVARDGRVVYAAGALASGTPDPAPVALTAGDALARAASLVGERVLPLAARSGGSGADRQTAFGQVAGTTVSARLVYVFLDADGAGGSPALRRAWEVLLPTADGAHVWLVRVDAATGAELVRRDLIVNESFAPDAAHGAERVVSLAPVATPAPTGLAALAAPALAGSYTVYAFPLESPLWATPAPPADARTAVANPDNALASPFGWHDTDGVAGAEFTVTRGNNAFAYTDIDANNLPDAGSSPDGGAGLTFNFPINLAGDPSTYRPAAVTNLFYWTNLIHDITYQYGFTEAAGNFQTNNYGRGGATFDDAVYSEAQDASSGSGNCNANFWTPNDVGNDAGSGFGSRPRMQMYTCDFPAGALPDVDGDLDAGVIVHEYGHGISNRLVGGPSVITCLGNSEQMGEGWSDIYGLLFTLKAGDTRTTRRPIGNYLIAQAQTGAGIRGTGYQPAPGAPYTTDFAVNSATYGSTVTVGQAGGLSSPHGLGFVWATILWEVTWDLIDAQGGTIGDVYAASGTAGNQIMMNLVTTGLKLTPCNPGFVQGRNAIFAADALLYPDAANPGFGIHHATLYTAFARRGLGVSASQGLSSSNADNVQAFDVPLAAAQVSVASAPISRLAAPGGTAAATVQIGNAGPTGNVVYSSSLQNITFVPAARPAPVPAASPAVAGEIVVHAVKGAPDAPQATTAPAVDAAQRTATGGGYTFDDSTEPGGPVYAFTSIAGTGTAVVLTDDATTLAIPLPFAFPFYGANQANVFIGSNGILSFGAGTTALGNVAIPTAAAPNHFIAPFWDDLNPGAGGTIHHQTVGSTFVVQFTSIRRFSDGTSSVSFQVVLKPTGEITITYQGVPTTNNSATIGIENATGTLGLQAAFNEVYAAPNLAVRFRPGRTWLTASNTSGSVAPSGTAQIGLAFDGTGLTEGTYTANLVVTTNAVSGSTTTIPVALTIGGQGVVAGSAGWRLLAAPATGVTVATLAAVNLVQGIPGYYASAGANLFTGYTGSAYTTPAGGSTVLAPGRGFWWYFYNQNLTPGGASNSTVLPTTLATTNPAVTADTPVTLHAAGTKYNLLGNPFGTSMRIDNVSSWPGATNLGSVVAQVWDASTSSYDLSLVLPTVAPWQGFWVEGATAGTLTIPASARTTGGVLQRDAPAPLVGFTLAQADGPLQDRAAVLTFAEGATDGADVFDADKLAPAAGAYVVAALGDAGALQAVASRPAPTAAAVSVPLHVASVGAGERLVLSWPHLDALPDGWAVTLTDTQTGATVDLRTTTEYAFTVVAAPAGDALAMPEAVALTSSAFGTTPARFVVTVGPRGATAGEGNSTSVFALSAPAPNPARGRTTLAFSLATPGAARLTLVDLLGREIAVIADGDQAAGRHVATLDTGALAPGVYVVRLASGAQQATQRLVIVR